MTDPAAKRGDLIWADFGPSSGREKARRRPALVVSTQAYNAASSVLLICPLSARGKPWPFRVALCETDDARGWILVDQIRVIDPAARHAKPLGKVCAQTLARVDQLLAALFGLGDEAQ